MLITKNEIGSSLVWVLVVAATLSTLGMGYAVISRNELAIADNQHQAVDAFYVAQAGLEWGKHYIANNFSEIKSYSDADDIVGLYPQIESIATKEDFTQLADGSKVKVQLNRKESTTWILSSTGFDRQAQHTVRQFIDVGANLPEEFTDLSTPFWVAEGEPDDNDKPQMSGDPKYGDYPKFEEAFKALKDALKSKAEIVESSQELWDKVGPDKSLNGRIYYVNGNVTLPYELKGPGVIFADGDIEMDAQQNVSYNNGQNEPIYFIADGDVIFKSKKEKTAFLDYVSFILSGQFKANGLGNRADIRLTGSLLTDTIKLAGHSDKVTIDYTSSMDGWLDDYGLTGLEFTRWQDEGTR